jgi:hypothetical protein
VADVLISRAVRQVRANGHSKAWLAVVAGNETARAFYERSRWHDEGPFTTGIPSTSSEARSVSRAKLAGGPGLVSRLVAWPVTSAAEILIDLPALPIEAEESPYP